MTNENTFGYAESVFFVDKTEFSSDIIVKGFWLGRGSQQACLNQITN